MTNTYFSMGYEEGDVQIRFHLVFCYIKIIESGFQG